ncbi:MAG: hypothetical protein HUU10_15550 [Bacteroidetes bacterium]|nr:hypothetical protein [Bacteroidota bacterium]
METPAEYKAPKIYVIAGIRYRLVKCTPNRAETFDNEYLAAKTPRQKAKLARGIVERADPTSMVPEPNWETEAEMAQVLEVLHDFLSQYESTLLIALNFLKESNPPHAQIQKSGLNVGQKSGPAEKG